ncbi:MAG TPA: FMN-binding protein [Acidimicrobiia bacterium]|nr:FMN-binding protein [Acidimicrobiia bacterium]
MRRVVPVLVATAAGLALLLSFHTSPATPTRVAHAAPATNPPAAAAPPTTGTTAPAGSSGDTSSQPSTTTTAPSARREVDGPTVSTQYGDVQVRVTVANGRLVDVKALQLPGDRPRSARISDFAGPELRDEALQAQSANIDVVSGATYTSEGYAQSLQAALQAAGVNS